MLLPQHATPTDSTMRCISPPLYADHVVERNGQVVHRFERILMLLAQHATPNGSTVRCISLACMLTPR